jgi:hypothetical protein
MKKILYSFIILSVFILSTNSELFAKDSGKNKRSIKKILSYPDAARFNINNISTLIADDGFCDYNTNSNLEGLVFPKGSGKTAVFISGFLWGGKVKILLSGIPQDPSSSSARIYRVRKDFAAADLSSEIQDGEGTAGRIRGQYKKDWNEWPAADGAPYFDVNGDGKYNPDIDTPGVPGADQTIFYIANDLDSALTDSFYGSPPVGIEVHVTVWGYSSPAPYNNMYFKKYQVINKSNTNFTDVYFSQWSDVDDGGAEDDLDGCDTLLNLGYTYNSTSNDIVYEELSPPAVGFHFIQGPVADGSTSDTALFIGRILHGKKNLPMTGMGYIFKNDSYPYAEPTQGNYLSGSLYIYNDMQGKLDNGEYFPIPAALGGGVTPFPYSGDPATGQGFLDPRALDKRIMVSSGPVSMAPSDTQEVIIAEIIAGAIKYSNNLASVSLLKSYVLSADSLYKKGFVVPSQPNTPVGAIDINLINVFPNPYYWFNYNKGTSDSKYVTFNHLPQKATIRILNLAGYQVAKIEKNNADQYQRWNLVNDSGRLVPSGLYIIYIDMPELGATKILKAAVIQGL